MKIVRLILLSLLASLLFGFILGTIIRVKLEGPPVRYFVCAHVIGGPGSAWRSARSSSDGRGAILVAAQS